MTPVPDNLNFKLPDLIEQYISGITRRIRSRCVRNDVERELRNHFTEALEDTMEKDREKTARELVQDFGDPSTLGDLIKRAKKRCRPAWLKFTIRSLQAMGILIVLVAVYTLWAFYDKPSPTVDYLSEFNARVRPNVNDTLNAAPLYEKAQALSVDFPRDTTNGNAFMAIGGPLTASEDKAIRSWLNRNDPALTWIRQGSQKPYYWVNYKGHNLVDIHLPNVGGMRNLARALWWRTWLIDGEDQEKLLADIRPALAMGRHLQEGTSTIIEQLVGNAINAYTANQTRLLLKAGKIKPETLPSLARLLDETYPHGYPRMNFECEMICGLDIIQRTFTDGGLGGGHICPRELIKFSGDEGVGKYAFLILTHPRREETTNKLKEYYALLDQWNVSPFEQTQGGTRKSPFNSFMTNHTNNYIFRLVLPALELAVGQNFRSKAEFEATRTVVALLQYRKDQGRYPDSLSALVPDYLKEIPRDPYGPGSFGYKNTGNNFLLYSFGADFKDDGGAGGSTWGSMPSGQSPKPTEKSGDYVFWPAQPMVRK